MRKFIAKVFITKIEGLLNCVNNPPIENMRKMLFY